jgi:hypothetical protein
MGPTQSALTGLITPATARNNKLRAEDYCVHDWYRFILSFPPHLVRQYLERFQVGEGQVVLDPFCGTGTTLVECKKLGIRSVGIEAHPMPCFASRVKVDWSADPDGLLEHAGRVAELANERLAGLDEFKDLPLLSGQPDGERRELQTLPSEQQKLLLENSISILPLHRVLTLLGVLKQSRDKRFDRYERLALAKALVSGISNLEFGPGSRRRPC